MKQYIVPCFCFFICISAAAFMPVKAQVDVTDSLALVDIYKATKGAGWLQHANWLTAKPVATWYGITVKANRVTTVDLGENNLSGPLPASIGNLSNLDSLILYSNHLTGRLPAAIGKLSHLRYLILSFNFFKGSIPDSFGDLTRIEDLRLSYDRLTGHIPASLGRLATVSHLELSGNFLTGSIPSALGNLTNLFFLYLDDNRLSGEVPSSFRQLVNLRYFSLFLNHLTQKKNVDFLPASQTYISGSINANNFTFNGLEYLQRRFRGISYTEEAAIPLRYNGKTFSVDAGGTLSNNTYQWYREGEAGYVTIKGDSTYTPVKSGTYHVEVLNSAAYLLRLYSESKEVILPGDMAANDNKRTAGTGGVAGEPRFTVMPNPATDLITVQLSGSTSVVLYNNAGEIVRSQRINGKGDITVRNIANGSYHLLNKATGETKTVLVVH